MCSSDLQRITQPQMVTGLVVAVQHVAACWLLIHRWGYGYLGAAFAACWSTFLSLALLAAWVALAGKGEQASWLWAVGGNRLECGRASPVGWCLHTNQATGCTWPLPSLSPALVPTMPAGVGPPHPCGAAGVAHLCGACILFGRCAGQGAIKLLSRLHVGLTCSCVRLVRRRPPHS